MRARDQISVMSLLILQLILCILLSSNAFQDRGLYPFWITYSIGWYFGVFFCHINVTNFNLKVKVEDLIAQYI